MAVPKYDDLFNPLLEALHELGGSSSVLEMEEKVAEILKLTDKEINEIHRGNKTKLSYRLAWARNYLKRYGLLENSARAVWALTQRGVAVEKVNKADVNKVVRNLNVQKDGQHEELVEKQEIEDWEDQLLNILKKLSPNEFERLCQRILREAGFIQVTVTGKSGDGGIDGIGVVKVGGFLSFRIIFQCKRYQKSVSSQEIREFKGTMVGRAERGLFISTGSFTKDAKQEALRDGSPPIDLVDGQELVMKMKELGLGVEVKREEVVIVDTNWFSSFLSTHE